LLLILSLSTIYAQQAELSLEDAIIGRFSKLAPERLGDLQWVADNDEVSWRSRRRDKLFLRRPGTRSMLREIPLTEINAGIGVKMRGLPGINWLDTQSFYFSYQGTFYTYNIKTKEGKAILNAPEDAAIVDYHCWRR